MIYKLIIYLFLYNQRIIKNYVRLNLNPIGDYMKDISVIITAHNTQETIGKAVLSVLNDFYRDKIELIVVDNCSTDNTRSIVKNISKKHVNLKLIKVEKKKKTESDIKNIGIKNANGKYITFLDSNDKINVENLLNMVKYADMHDIDCIKGYYKLVNGNVVENKGKIVCDNNNPLDVMRNIIARESTPLDIIIKKDFICKNSISFNKNYISHENIIFYADLFSSKPKIRYYNSFINYHHRANDVNNIPTTPQNLDEKLKHQVNVWELAEKKLNKIGISYYELRLSTQLKNIINSLIYSNGNISKKTFRKISNFFNKNIKYLENNLTLPERYELVYNSILDANYENFLKLSKKRLLVVGNDFKFIEDALKYLKNDYDIKIDKWREHTFHEETKSLELLNWADFIFCEWLLGNAIWYSQRKMSHQKLFIRAHRFELNWDYGNQIDYTNVDGVIAVSYYYLELFANRFKIPRQKMILLANYVETDIYSGTKTRDFKHNIALVGYIPKLKGMLKGLKLLKMLKEHDEKFKLYLIGKNYRNLGWIWNDPIERSYFEECENFIKENHLEDSVIFKGWVERSEVFNDLGYVLSLSDIESFHLSPAEGLVALTPALLLKRDGVEYIYPEEIIFDNLKEIEDRIISTYNDSDKYNNLMEEMRNYVINEFNIENFVAELKLEFEKDITYEIADTEIQNHKTNPTI